MGLQKSRKPKISKEDMEAGINSCFSWNELARELMGNDNYCHVRTLKGYAKQYQLSTPHFDARKHLRNQQFKYSPEEVFTENSPAPNTVLAKMYRRYFPPVKCSECGIGTTWNNKPLTLHIDHINGHGTDWRLDNCRYLCPNCHYQTETHGTKRGLPSRANEIKATPSELSDSFNELGCYKQVGLIYGLSDRTVKDMIRRYRRYITQ